MTNIFPTNTLTLYQCLCRSPVLSQTVTRASSPRWTWTCDAAQRVCRKLQMNSSLSLASEARCRASCGPETSLWPLPHSLVMGGVRAAEFRPDLVIKNIGAPSQGVEEWLSDAIDFQLKKLSIVKRGGHSDASSLQSVIAVEVKKDGLDIDLDTKEDYELSVRCDQDANNIQIRAETYFGARHALETLFQMIHLDSYNLSFLVSCDVTISDGPHFSHRGVMLDTARFDQHNIWRQDFFSSNNSLQELRLCGHDQDPHRLHELFQDERVSLAHNRLAKLPPLSRFAPGIRRIRGLQPGDDLQQVGCGGDREVRRQEGRQGPP